MMSDVWFLFVHLCSWQFLFYILSCLLKDVLPLLFSVDVWFVLTFVLVHVNAWVVGPSGSPHFVLLGLANNCVD